MDVLGVFIHLRKSCSRQRWTEVSPPLASGLPRASDKSVPILCAQANAFLTRLLIRVESRGVTFPIIMVSGPSVSFDRPQGLEFCWGVSRKRDLRKPRPVLLAPRGARPSPATPSRTLDLSGNVTLVVPFGQLTQIAASLLGDVGQWTYLPARPGQPGGMQPGICFGEARVPVS